MLPYLAYLSEERDKLSKCLDSWSIERTQERKDHQRLKPGARRQLYDIEEWNTMVARVCCDRLR